MKNKEFGKVPEKRTRDFIINIIKLSASLDRTLEFKVIRYQIVKSGTSIGANYREANRSRSKVDFVNRVKICQAETNETIYWLELLLPLSNNRKTELSELYTEANELLALFTSINNTMVNKQAL